MRDSIRKARFGAIFGACVCGLATFFFLFGDVLRAWSFGAITNDHMAAFAALCSAVFAGHYCTEEWRAQRFVLATGAAILVGIATWYVVTASAARTSVKNAELATQIKTANADRARIERDLVKAEADVDSANTALKAAESEWSDARATLKAECRTGKGKLCQGHIEAEAVARQAVREAREAVKTAGDRYGDEQGKLSATAAPRVENASFKAIARAYAALPMMAGTDVEALAERLSILLPLGLAVIAELGTIVFSSIARHPRHPPTAPAAQKTPTSEAPRLARPRAERDDSRHVLDVLRERGGLTNNELAAAMGVTPGEATKRRRPIQHLLQTEKRGRELAISLRRELH